MGKGVSLSEPHIDHDSSPPSRSKIIKIHGIIIGSHSCNATLDSTSRLALQKLRLHAYSVREGTSIARSTRFSARLGNKIDRF